MYIFFYHSFSNVKVMQFNIYKSLSMFLIGCSWFSIYYFHSFRLSIYWDINSKTKFQIQMCNKYLEQSCVSEQINRIEACSQSELTCLIFFFVLPKNIWLQRQRAFKWWPCFKVNWKQLSYSIFNMFAINTFQLYFWGFKFHCNWYYLRNKHTKFNLS